MVFKKGQIGLRLGAHHTPEANEKNRQAHLGKIPWNMGKKGVQRCSVATRKKMSESHKGQIAWNKGKNHSFKTIKQMSDSRKGEKNKNWKGGISKSRSVIYEGISYKKWRELVFKRDNYTCKRCGDKTGHNLEAHHIIGFAQCLKENVRLIYELSNGITLCELCHKEIHNMNTTIIEANAKETVTVSP